MTDSIKRLLDFVAENGGVPLIASKTGLTESVFHNYKNPKRKNENVGGEVHAKMKSAFPHREITKKVMWLVIKVKLCTQMIIGILAE